MCEPYLIALRKKEKKRFREFKKDFDTQFTWEIITDFGNKTDLFEKLYLRVLEKSKNQFEQLNERFFFYLNKFLPESSFFLVAKDKSNEIRVMELVIEESDRIIPLYIGINYKKDEENTKVLYFKYYF